MTEILLSRPARKKKKNNNNNNSYMYGLWYINFFVPKMKYPSLSYVNYPSYDWVDLNGIAQE